MKEYTWLNKGEIMKRQITAALAAGFLFGIQNKNAQDESTQEESAQEESTQEECAEKVRYSYGEAEIPDIPCGDGSFEGKADCQADSEDSI